METEAFPTVDPPIVDTITMVSLSPIHKNRTIVDVVLLGCICNFDPLACIRNGILSLFVIILGLLCLAKVAKLVDIGGRYHQVAVFSLASAECLLITVHWLYMYYPEIELVVQLLKMAQLVIVCHFYLSRCVRLLRRDYLNKLVVLPVLIVFGAYFVAVTVLGVIFSQSQERTCEDPFWVMFSAVECFLVQMFLMCGFYITKKLNDVTTLRSQRREQKRNLWSIILAFEMSSIATVIYDSYMLGSMDGRQSCSEVYHDNNVSFTIVYLLLMVFKIIVPILTLLVVFHPVDRESDEGIYASSSDYNTYSSTFSPTHSYRRLYSPGTDNHGNVQYQGASPSQARRTQSFPRMPIIKEEAEPMPPSSLPIQA